MNKMEILILLLLNHEGATNWFQSISVNEILDTEDFPDLKANTVYKTLIGMERLGIVSRGAKDIRSATFYITEAGLDKIGELK